MEVKVWVEGIQRVVCGVSDRTTCQDIVFALAHATGRTGRFTLVEKWRDTERLLSPSEYPLQVLHKWGEYANDVQFVLRHSEKDKRRQSGHRRREKADGVPLSLPLQDGKSSSSAIKKSLTFSGVHARSNSDLKHDLKHIHHAQQSSLPNGYPEFDPVMPDLVAQDSNYRLPGRDQNQIPNGKREHITSPQSSLANDILPYLQRNQNDDSITYLSGQSRKANQQKTANGSPVLLNGGKTHNPKETSVSEEKEELLRLIQIQENRLKDQDSRLQHLGLEIEVLPEFESTEYTYYCDAISRLERNNHSLEEELQELQLVSWPDKVALGKTEQNALKSELSDLRENLEQIEQSLEEHKQKMTTLSQELAEESDNLKLKQVELKQNLQGEIELKLKELNSLDEQNKELETNLKSVEKNNQSCDTSLVERRLQYADLEKDVKETNMENFSKIPSLLAVEDVPLTKQRPGSARRLTSNPQQLAEKVATARDPQGLWV